MRLKMIAEFTDPYLDNYSTSDYIDPDVLWQPKTKPISFIYNPDNILHYDANPSVTHTDIIEHNISYYRPLYNGPDSNLYHIGAKIRDVIENVSLLGRTGQLSHFASQGNGSPQVHAHIISFWNDNKKIYDKLLEPCLQALLNNNIITNDSYISTPLHKTIPISQLDTTKTQDFDEYKLWLKKNLHLMKPAMKKQAMKELGLNTMGKKSEWQSAAEKEGIVQPGQKWWAMTSESV